MKSIKSLSISILALGLVLPGAIAWAQSHEDHHSPTPSPPAACAAHGTAGPVAEAGVRRQPVLDGVLGSAWKEAISAGPP